MSESDRRRVDDTPGAAGSVTEASDPTAEQNPAERAVGPAESLPGARPDRGADEGGPADEEDRAEEGTLEECGSEPASGTGVPTGAGPSGGDYVDEFRPEPVRQRPSKGQHGPDEGPQVTPMEEG
ncbi:hypothetical protein [Thermomonospora umbrina]|uniref:Uncharacterized protein n=1 Tax=Thermomonospora umbrina TaxID=111806 RepID=A0A3D9SG02_9ACTN|nr:hypothetical protein [Thermomonospora umbrina]REE94848.1 hypothetical protein DFJ69_0217 [Thermomonospora umbrina]